MRKRHLMLATALTALALAPLAARADGLVDEAKASVAKATARVDKWDGPTTGPKAVGAKSIVYVAGDMRNGGILGVASGVKEAATAIGWKYREIDGQGSVSGQANALERRGGAQARRHHRGRQRRGRAEGGPRRCRQARNHHRRLAFRPEAGSPRRNPVYANVTTDSMQVAKLAAMMAIADSNGKAGVVIFADSTYAIAIAKGRAMEAEIKKCADCKVLAFEDTPLADVSTRIPQLTTTLLQQNGAKWGYSLAINDLYYDFMPPALEAAGIAGDGSPKNVSAGDGSESAYQRIRAKDHQTATVPEPLNMQGWQLVDELNRAFSKAPWSGYVPNVHLVTADNIAFDGGPKNVFDPDNGYRDAYKKIWSAK